MKKLTLIFSLAFFAFIVSASAQSSASTEKETTATEKVDCGVEAKTTKAKSKGCCAHSSSSKAKCYAKGTSEAKKSDTETPAETVAGERKAVAAAGTESK